MKEKEKERLCERLEKEAGKILDQADRSELTTGGLESLYKIVDIMKDIDNMKYWDVKCEYYETILDEMQGGYSERGYSRSGNYSNESGYSNRRDSRVRYSRDGGESGYENGSSYANRGQHWVRGHYSRADGRDPYDDYMMEKQSYRSSGKSEDCKRRMLGALEDHLNKLTEEIGEMGQDAECREEREMIKKYMQKLQTMM